MPVLMLVAAAAVLIGVVVVATGRGGELAFFPADYSPLKLDQVTSTDVALFRPPTALWGYSMQATDEALSHIASAITERDIEISALQQQVADLKGAAAGQEAAPRGGAGRGTGTPASPAGRGVLPPGPPAMRPGADALPSRPDVRPSGPDALPSRPDVLSSGPDAPPSRRDVRSRWAALSRRFQPPAGDDAEDGR